MQLLQEAVSSATQPNVAGDVDEVALKSAEAKVVELTNALQLERASFEDKVKSSWEEG